MSRKVGRTYELMYTISLSNKISWYYVYLTWEKFAQKDPNWVKNFFAEKFDGVKW